MYAMGLDSRQAGRADRTFILSVVRSFVCLFVRKSRLHWSTEEANEQLNF